MGGNQIMFATRGSVTVITLLFLCSGDAVVFYGEDLPRERIASVWAC